MRSPGKPALKKALGQHHLRSSSLCRPLVDYLGVEGRRVLEIGPGGGALTRALLDREARVFAVELDPAWAFQLLRESRNWQIDSRALLLWVQDALELDWTRFCFDRVAGNLPYSIATTLVLRWCESARPGDRGAFLVQREVADRLLATPADSCYGSLSVLVAARASGHRLGRLAPGSFRPPPRVESAFVGLAAEAGLVKPADWPDFKNLVRLAFRHRRKTLVNNLSQSWSRERAFSALSAARINSRSRAQEVDLNGFVRLFEALTRHS